MSGSDAYKGGGTQAERRAYWAAFWEAEAIKSEMRLKRLQGIAAQLPLSEKLRNAIHNGIAATEAQKVASTGYVRSKIAELNAAASQYITPPPLSTQETTPSAGSAPIPIPPPNGPHTYDHAAGMRPMKGTYVTERTTKTWPSGTFPKQAMR